MINTSALYKQYITKTSRSLLLDISLTYTNASGSQITENLDDSDIDVSSLKFKNQCINGVLAFGSTSSKTLNFTLKNDGKFDGCKLRGGVITVKTGIVCGDTDEYVTIGTFNITSAGQPLKLIKCEACDDMMKFEKNYYTTLTYPTTLSNVLSDICTQAGIEFSGSLYFGNMVVSTQITEDYTLREILSDIAEIEGGFATISNTGELNIINFIDNMSSAYEINESNMRISSEFYVEGHRITGVCYKNKGKYLAGTTDYCLSVPSNMFLEDSLDIQRMAYVNYMYLKYKDYLFFPYSSVMRFDGSLQVGDYVKFTNVKTINGIEDVYSMVGSISCNLNGQMNIDTDDTDEIDLQNILNSGNTHASGESGGVTEVENDNLLLLSVFNTATMPEQAGNTGSITSTSGIMNLDCISSKCSLNTSTLKYMNQLMFPCQCLTEGTYTFSILCRRTTTEQAYLNNSLCKYFYKILDVDTNSTHLKDQFAGNWATSFMIVNKDWEWVSFTFTLNTTIKRPIIIIQCYQLETGTYSNYQEFGAIEVVKGMLEVGTVFTKYKQSKSEAIRINGTTSGYPMIKDEILSVKSADSSIPICRLSNCEYTPGSSHITCGMASDYVHITRVYNNEYETGYTQKDYGIEMFNINKVRTPGVTTPTKTTIKRDTSNNLNIKCNTLTVNGTTIPIA